MALAMNHHLVQKQQKSDYDPGSDSRQALGMVNRPMFARILVQIVPCRSPAWPGASSWPDPGWSGRALSRPRPGRPLLGGR